MPGPTAFRRSRPAMLPALLVLAALAAAPAGPAGAEEMPGRLVARSWGQITGTAIAGRVTTIDLGLSPGATVDILSRPSHGNVTVNPDNTLALVLTGSAGTGALRFDLRITKENGREARRRVALDVVPGGQAGGWGPGHFYLLETAADDQSLIEHGRAHRKVYVSKHPRALSISDIARREGVDVKRVTGKFLSERPLYGAGPAQPLDEEAGRRLWMWIADVKRGPQSNWLLLERGYSYDNLRLFPNHTLGESPLHPMLISAFGTGARPEVTNLAGIIQKGTRNVVVKGVALTGRVSVMRGSNFLFEDVDVTRNPMAVFNVDGFTLRYSYVHDVRLDEPVGGSQVWEPHRNRVSGMFLKNNRGVLFDRNVFDHNGWADGYDPDLSATRGQPPSMYSHNLYLQHDNLDATLRDNIMMRSAATGTQMRPGGFIEDNVFLDNNGAVNFVGGGKERPGNYTLFTGNLVTSGGHKRAAEGVGALTIGVSNIGNLSTLHDNVVAHLADPANPEEIAAKEVAQYALKHWENVTPPVHDNTIVYNWTAARSHEGSEERNTDGLDPATMMRTTIQVFTAQLLGRPGASIRDLGRHLGDQARGPMAERLDPDAILAFFRAGFGLDRPERTTPGVLRFVPNPLGDGVRWDNRLNWSTGDLPGTLPGDRVALAGNWVQYAGAGTLALPGLDFGDGGRLTLTGGRLDIGTPPLVGPSGAELTVVRSGQAWLNGYDGAAPLTITAQGGRFANTGQVTGTVHLQAGNMAQTILATGGAVFAPGPGSTLTLQGGQARTGFDGRTPDPAVLRLSGDTTLRYEATDGAFGRIAEFTSGRFGHGGVKVRSGVNLGGAQLRLDIAGLAPRPAHELMRVDEVVGTFGSVEIDNLPASRDARIVIDYAADTVTLELGAPNAGDGQVRIVTRGKAEDARADTALYTALSG